MSKIEDPWLVQLYQHGVVDSCETPTGFATEAEAMAHAKAFAEDVPYTSGTEHECVVFKAVATYRGKLKPVKHKL